MAAGLGFKTFTTGEVLSASDVNGYLMQGINVFADATARDAAITSPQEGQFAYTKDNNSLWYYSGSTWVASGATGDIEGVSVTSPITGGGTSGTVTIGIDSTAVVPSQTGNSGKYLTTNGTSSSWGTISAGGMTLLASGTLSGAAVALTSIDQTYKALRLVLQSTSMSASDQGVLRFNNDSSTSYTQVGMYASGGASGTYYGGNTTVCKIHNLNASSTQTNQSAVADFPNYAQTGTVKLINLISGYYNPDNTAWVAFMSTTNYFANAAISSIYIRADFGGSYTWDNGNYYLYGVN